MIITLLITLVIEGAVVLLYCTAHRRPAGPLLLAGFMINVFTQAILWLALRMFFRYYLIALIAAELSIWLVEGVFLHRLPGNGLTLRQAMTLSFWMNAASFGVGLFLPV